MENNTPNNTPNNIQIQNNNNNRKMTNGNRNNSNKYKLYCGNCGKIGHTYKKCVDAIISMGVILYNTIQINNYYEIKIWKFCLQGRLIKQHLPTEGRRLWLEC